MLRRQWASRWPGKPQKPTFTVQGDKRGTFRLQAGAKTNKPANREYWIRWIPKRNKDTH